MKATPSRRHRAGYISFLLVLATGSILTILTISAFRRAIASQAVQAQVQLRADYGEKEEAILRSIVALTPNRAIRAMQPGSDVAGTRDALRWRNIFTESLALANAGKSIPDNVLNSLNLANYKPGNSGNSTLSSPDRIFSQMVGVNDNLDTSFASAGINRSLGPGFPVPLTSANPTTIDRDRIYPLISTDKVYGDLAQSGVGLPVATYDKFNLLPYPAISFGYATPGELFVAKRNWWAFSLDVADHDNDRTGLALTRRDFVLSIYEIPSQLSISASSFMSLGQYASGSAWQNVQIDGGMFVGQAEVTGTTPLNALALRRGATISSTSTIGSKRFDRNPFTPGEREIYLREKDNETNVSAVNQTTMGAFFPVSMASESGRAAFIPISRGAKFFDRFDAAENDPVEPSGARDHIGTDVLSPTTWNNYSIGAQQCAMRLDITAVHSPTDSTPTELRFQYYQPNGNRAELQIPLPWTDTTHLPLGYVDVWDEGETHTFETPVDLMYGNDAGYALMSGASGTITFDIDTFGDPSPGNATAKRGYWRPMMPFDIQTLASSQKCVVVFPERIPPFLAAIGGAGVSDNHSLVVNVDYTVTGLNDPAMKPSIPCHPAYPADPLMDYGVILRECANLVPFTRGFSLVTNMRLYIGGDFNTATTAPPPGFTPRVTASNPSGLYFPPCSLFTPEKRWGADADPLAVILGGQIGSLAKVDKVNTSDSDADVPKVRPLDSKVLSGAALAANRITVNLSQIRHPAELPPIYMMNWLIHLEERRR